MVPILDNASHSMRNVPARLSCSEKKTLIEIYFTYIPCSNQKVAKALVG